MVKLRNLKKNDLTGECDIFPENSIAAGHVVIDMAQGDVKGYFLPKGYEYCINHVYHAARHLKKLLEKGEWPKEYTVMWY